MDIKQLKELSELAHNAIHLEDGNEEQISAENVFYIQVEPLIIAENYELILEWGFKANVEERVNAYLKEALKEHLKDLNHDSFLLTHEQAMMKLGAHWFITLEESEVYSEEDDLEEGTRIIKWAYGCEATQSPNNCLWDAVVYNSTISTESFERMERFLAEMID